jgi:hypothetical protein
MIESRAASSCAEASICWGNFSQVINGRAVDDAARACAHGRRARFRCGRLGGACSGVRGHCHDSIGAGETVAEAGSQRVPEGPCVRKLDFPHRVARL